MSLWRTALSKRVLPKICSSAKLVSFRFYSRSDTQVLHNTLLLFECAKVFSLNALQSAVLRAISEVGSEEEAKNLGDVERKLPKDVLQAVLAHQKGGPRGLAGFIFKEMKDTVQFLSEDNIQDSRIVLRSSLRSLPEKKPGSPTRASSERHQLPPTPVFGKGNAQSKAPINSSRPKTMTELLDRLIDYLPTSFVQSNEVATKLPKNIQDLYADSNFVFFLKRFRHYVDIRTQHGNSEVRLKPDFSHPRRGKGDELYETGLGRSSGAVSNLIRRAPRNSEANLVGFLAPRIPKEYTPIATVLSEVSDVVSRHPAFDPRLGVTGLLEKYTDYFQINEGRMRSRPYRSAPFSLDDFDEKTSPDPEVFTKLFEAVKKGADGVNYSENKALASVSTGKLYALLTSEEKIRIKKNHRSFPRFLRLHGKCIVVSSDFMKVYLFKPEFEACADTLMDHRLRENSLSPDDPVLKIPATIDENTSIDWAVAELYDALPLTQCADLQDILYLVPSSVRSGLPANLTELKEVLASYPEYFTLWQYPDDPSITIVQRAKIEIPDYSNEQLMQLILPVVPHGGVSCAALVHRVPLPLQRFFSKHGLRKTLERISSYVQITKDDRVVIVGSSG